MSWTRTEWPSGPRRQTQVLFSREAWVRIPPPSLLLLTGPIELAQKFSLVCDTEMFATLFPVGRGAVPGSKLHKRIRRLLRSFEGTRTAFFCFCVPLFGCRLAKRNLFGGRAAEEVTRRWRLKHLFVVARNVYHGDCISGNKKNADKWLSNKYSSNDINQSCLQCLNTHP